MHISQVENEAMLNDEDSVEFEPTSNDRGLAAQNVKKATDSEDTASKEDLEETTDAAVEEEVTEE